MKTQFSFDNATFEAERILKIRLDQETQQLQGYVKWLGFSETENSWEPLITLKEDAPTLIANFIQENKDDPLVDAIKEMMNVSKPSNRQEPTKNKARRTAKRRGRH